MKYSRESKPEFVFGECFFSGQKNQADLQVSIHLYPHYQSNRRQQTVSAGKIVFGNKTKPVFVSLH